MIIYKKSTGGRLTTPQKTLLADVNKLIRELPLKERKRFKDIVVNNDKDLQNIYANLMEGNVKFEFKGANPDSMIHLKEFEKRKNLSKVSVEKAAPTQLEEKSSDQLGFNFDQPPAGKEEVPEVETTESTDFIEQEEEQIINQEKTPIMPEDQIPDVFSPLDAPAKERSYNQTQTMSHAEEIPEPIFSNSLTPEEMGTNVDPGSAQNVNTPPPSGGYAPPPPPSQEPSFASFSNPGMNDLDEKEKKIAVKQTVDTVLDGYAMLHTLAANYAKIDESVLTEKFATGEIDPEQTIPLEGGKQTTVIEFAQEFNEQAEEALSYDPAFGDKVRPAMERVFMKKGWGMTDEQFLMVAFGKDIAMKGAMFVGMKKTQNMMLNLFAQMKQTQIQNQQEAEAHVERVRPDTITTPPPSEEREKVVPLTPQDAEDAIIEDEQ